MTEVYTYEFLKRLTTALCTCTSHHVLSFHDIKFLAKFNCTLNVPVGKNMRMYYGDVGEGMVEKVITEVKTHGECRDFT